MALSRSSVVAMTRGEYCAPATCRGEIVSGCFLVCWNRQVTSHSPLVANPINRYLLNSPMLPQFTMDADGGLTLFIQSENPGAPKETNWLPAAKGPFSVIMRLYWPKAEALEGKWTPPPLRRAD